MITDPTEIYDVLVEECGAPVDDGIISTRGQFKAVWPCGEFRFQGNLGFGGKISSEGSSFGGGEWHHSEEVFVSCYSEDRTPERDAMIKRANERLAGVA